MDKIPPILFVVFNRPDLTSQAFAKIRDVKPQYLYIGADGPRTDQNSDIELCSATRKIIDEGIDWDCKVYKRYLDTNVGCQLAISGAISWFFENVAEGIILEDDCVPHEDFFLYCHDLLQLYRHDDRIGHIGGNNFQRGKRISRNSYYFSRYPHIWGWATWKRAWKGYSDDVEEWFKTDQIIRSSKFDSLIEFNYWESIFSKLAKTNEPNTWDYRWLMSCWMTNKLSIYPEVNLVKNIGFGENATHTFTEFHQSEVQAILPLKHPDKILRNVNGDKRNFRLVFSQQGIHRSAFKRIRSLIKKCMHKVFFE